MMLRLFSAPLEMFLAVRKRRPRRRWERARTKRGSRSRPVRVPEPSFTPPQHPPLASPSH
jgi:hypothetical protein